MPRDKSKGFVVPWKLLALILGPMILLGIIAAALIVSMQHSAATTYDDGIADPTDFSKEEAALRAYMARTYPDRKITGFGPHHRFTKAERERMRSGIGFNQFMDATRPVGRPIDPDEVHEPPVAVLRVLTSEPFAESYQSRDWTFWLNPDGSVPASGENNYGDKWIQVEFPHARPR